MSAPDDTAARLRRAVTRLNRRLRQTSLGGISPAQASMLATIEKLVSPSLGALAVAEQIQPPSVTRLVQSLVDAGLCVRTVDPGDRRSQRVSLTPTGKRELALIRKKKTEFLREKIAAFSPSDQTKAEELATLLERILDES
jgi:DNA-binding MarR family transcriptional regulator